MSPRTASPEVEPRADSLTVVAGVIFVDGRVLVGQRKAGGRHSLKWEFPGGKVEPGEGAGAALVRELREELGIETKLGGVLQVTAHGYPGGPSVEISFVNASEIDGAPSNRAFADVRWVPLGNLHELDFLEADRDFVNALQRGAVIPATTAWRVRTEADLEACDTATDNTTGGARTAE